jgi:hypothetical protein
MLRARREFHPNSTCFDPNWRLAPPASRESHPSNLARGSFESKRRSVAPPTLRGRWRSSTTNRLAPGTNRASGIFSLRESSGFNKGSAGAIRDCCETRISVAGRMQSSWFAASARTPIEANRRQAVNMIPKPCYAIGAGDMRVQRQRLRGR